MLSLQFGLKGFESRIHVHLKDVGSRCTVDNIYGAVVRGKQVCGLDGKVFQGWFRIVVQSVLTFANGEKILCGFTFPAAEILSADHCCPIVDS